MKILIALFAVLTLNVSYADQGQVTSTFSPTISKNNSIQTIGLYLANECYQDVYVVTRTRDYNGVWQTRGYFRIPPGYKVYDTSMSHNFYYLHARTYDGQLRWEGPHNIEFDGYILKARLIELPGGASGDWTTTLTCN